MRKFDRHDTLGLEKLLDAGDEVVGVRDLGEDIVPDDEICPFPFRDQLTRNPPAKQADQRWDSLCDGRASYVASRLDSEHRNCLADKELKQVSVVATEFDYQTARTETEAVRNRIGVPSRVREPGVGI